MFTLIHGNRQEVLAQHLATQLAADPLPIFERDVVVVQSGGMARWLQMFLAESLGVATQLRFTFPAAYLWSLFGAVLPEVPKETPFARDILSWQLLRLLNDLPETDTFTPVRHYLADGDVHKRHELAAQLANCFDRYLAYRPEWVGRWFAGQRCDLGGHEAWQAWLWQRIGAEASDLPSAHPADQFIARLRERPDTVSLLPRRISIFGSGAMPPPYLQKFRELGEFIDVSFYLVNPCAGYWGDLVTQRVKARAALENPALEPLLDTGHPLLGSLGQVTRATFELLAAGNEPGLDEDLFVSPVGTEVLAVVQQDMLDMYTRTADTRVPLDPADHSIQFHICHGATRELEVLHDRLLALFAADPTLRPSDVLVLTPDIIGLAPLIEAVFAPQGQGTIQSIPFTIADRPLELESPLLRAFNSVLDLARGRLDVESVLGVLAQPCVANRFGMDDEDLALVRAWVGESGIRWGLSGQDRAARGLPEEELHSWAYGLRRMLLGMALPQHLLNAPAVANTVPLHEGLLPFDAIEGVRAQTLSRLLDYIEALAQTLRELAVPRTVTAWAELLPQLCQRFCYDPDTLLRADHSTQRAVQKLRDALQGLTRSATQARCEELIPLDVMRRELRARVNEMPPGWAFLGGGITFAQLLAYRGVPARVVCLIGMNDGAFPRNPALPGFDLLQRHPRPGDREARAEDRHAFLEALLSAREYLHVSYTGRGLRDNAELPPSTLVSELMDVIDMTVSCADGRVASASLSIVHRLQAFSPRYFDGSDSRYYSHAEVYAAAANARVQRGDTVGTAAQPFLAAPLPTVPDTLCHITPQQFSRFFRNPAQHLLRSRFGIHLEESEGLLDTIEPFVPTDLARFQLRNQLVLDWQQGVRTRDDARALALARGQLPHGQAGQVIFDALWDEFQPFAARVQTLQGTPLPPCRIDLALNGVKIEGSIGDCFATDTDNETSVLHLCWRIGKVRPQDKLQLWIEHLLLQAAGVPCRSLMLGTQGQFELSATSNTDLAPLVQLYLQGSCALLPFFPATSLNWWQHTQSGKPKDWQQDWHSKPHQSRSESEDPYNALAWRDASPFDTPWFNDFVDAATIVFSTLPLALSDEDDSDGGGQS